MTTSTINRAVSLLLLGIGVASITVRAAQPTFDSMALDSSSVHVGLPDRDVVRDPYSSLLGNIGSFSVPQNLGVVGPNLGSGVGIPPGLIVGGGGGSSLSFGSGGSVGFLPPASGGSNIPSGTGSTSGSVNNGGLNLPSGGTSTGGSSTGSSSTGGSSTNSSSTGSSSSSTTIVTQSIVVSDALVTQPVPEGGTSAILLGAGLLAIFLLRRRLA